MSRIVIDARESGTGSGRYVDKLIEYLHKLQPKHEVTLLAKPHRVDFLEDVAPNFNVFETSVKEFTFAEQLKLNRQIKSLNADLVHFTFVNQPVLYRRPVVTTIQDLTTVRFRNPDKNPVMFWAKQQVLKWVIRRASHRSRQLITPTQFVKDDSVAFTHVNPNKITVTYEAADSIPDAEQPLPNLTNKQFIMYLGRPTPHKNLGRLIDAFVEVRKTHPDLYLVLAGKTDRNYQRHAARIEREGISHVIFTDFITEGQLKWLYTHCQAYVFPSLSEGFGLPALEALLHGAPLVSSNATCSPEVYGNAAHYFDPLSIEDMVVKISEVLDDPILREDLVEKGKKQAAKYSWRRMAEQTLAVYEKALKG